MATIEKRGDGYRITVAAGIDISGKQLRKRMTWTPDPKMTERQRQKELQRQATLFEEQVNSGYKMIDGKIRLIDFSEIFMKDYVEVYKKKNTISRYKRDLKRILPALGHLKLEAITPKHINSFAAMLQEDGINENGGRLAASSVDTILRTLSSILGKAVKWGYIRFNPCQSAEGPGPASEEARYLDEPDARKLLQLLQDEPITWRAFITCDLLSGLRRGELLGLQWHDIDFDEHLIHINRTWNYTDKTTGCYFATPKTARSKRPLHLSTAVFMILLEYQRWQDQQRETLGDAWKGTPDDDRVFTSDDGRPIFPTVPTQWFRKFVQRTGLPSVSIHSLRHTYASLMIADDVPLVEISSQLGHARVSTTEDIYGHVIASAHAKALRTFDKFNSLLGVPESPQNENSPQIHPKTTKTGA